MDPYTLSGRYQPQLDQQLRSIISDSSLSLYHMMRYHMGWVDVDGQARLSGGGKQLRSSLCLLACEAVGGNWEQAVPAAASLELLHNFTLIHDDIEDGDNFRRGMPTVWNIYGIPQGINCGDALHVLSSKSLLDLEKKGISTAKTIVSVSLLHETALRLCEGQFLDISFENLMHINIDDYYKMIQGKTAALFGCSLKLGALIGSDDEKTIERLYEFGINLGMAFQIHDDILGIWGQDSKTGKSSASDIVRKKKTLPIVYALNNATNIQAEELKSIYTQDKVGQSEKAFILRTLEKLGALQYCSEHASQYMEKAKYHLSKANIPAMFRDEFEKLAEFIVVREY